MIDINVEKCIGCGLCVKDCFPKDIEMTNKKANFKNVTCMKCGHCIAVCPTKAISMDEYDMDDVKEYDKNTFDIEPERMLNFIKFRRSIRQFKNQAIEDDKILKTIEAGRFTPTGENRQSVSYIVVRENISMIRSLAIKELGKMGQQMLNQEQQNPALINYAKRWVRMYESEQQQAGKDDELFFNAPTVILAIGDSAVDAALAASNMELMAFAQGLGMFYSGFFVRAAQGNAEIKALLGLKQNKEVLLCMVLGYPDVTYKRTVPRKQAQINWR